MTNDAKSELEDCSADELAFWEIGPEAGERVLRDTRQVPVQDLEERTARFGGQIILFAMKIPCTPVNSLLIHQLVGAGTRIGANYCGADEGASGREFKHCIGACRKEARETKYFLRMIAVAESRLKPEARDLWREAHALHRLFSRIWRSTKL